MNVVTTLTSTLLLIALSAAAQSVPHFAPVQSFNTPNGSYWTTAGDFNGDGITDLASPDGAIANNINGFFYTLGLPGGGFGPVQSRSIGGIVHTIHAADVNKDGKTDIIAATTNGVAVLLGNTAGSFQPTTFAPMALSPNHAVTGDFNNDTHLDIVAAGTTGYSVSLGNGAGAFAPARLFSQLNASFWVIAGDFNNDGKLDFAGQNGASGTSYLGDGAGNFLPPTATIAIPWGAIAADFGRDGKLDLAMHTAQPRQDGSNYAVTIALGNGAGQFTTYSNYVTGIPMRGLVAADFNQDGLMDVATQVSSTGKIMILSGGMSNLNLDLAPVPNGTLLAADIDANGSKDLVWGAYQQTFVFRSTHGNPPLLAQVSLSPASVIGGAARSTATVTLGGPAPASGATITLSSSNPAAFFTAGSTLTIPAGVTSATFDITTTSVPEPTSSTITATWNGVSQTARLDIVPPYTLTSLSINPGSQYGGLSATGTITLSGPADSAAVVTLGSGNPALAAVPLAVTVPAGATSVNFPITLQPVAANTAVLINAQLDGIATTSPITILRAQDTVAVSRAILTLKNAQLKIEATSTSATTTLTAYNPITGALLGTLSNNGGGKYSGTVFAPTTLTSVTVRSTLGGAVTVPVERK